MKCSPHNFQKTFIVLVNWCIQVECQISANASAVSSANASAISSANANARENANNSLHRTIEQLIKFQATFFSLLHYHSI